jgi:hypothetical protein
MIGANIFSKVIEANSYDHLKGGVLEAFGRLFAQNLRVYLYPSLDKETGKLITTENLPIDPSIASLYRYLLENKKVVDVTDVKTEWLTINSDDVRYKIQHHDPSWEKMVPHFVSKFIKKHQVLDYSE